LLLLTQSRSGNVEVQEVTKPVEPKERPRRGWLVAAAAFAAVIVVIGVTPLIGRSATELDPAAPPTTQAAPPTTVAVPPTTVPVVEEEAVEAPPTTVAVVEDVLSAEDQAFVDSLVDGFNSADKESVLALASPSAKYTSYILQEAVLRLIVADGAATTVTLTEALSSMIPEAAEFVAWMEAEYPDDLPLMLSDTQPPPPLLDEGSIALWTVRYPEWKATLEG